MDVKNKHKIETIHRDKIFIVYSRNRSHVRRTINEQPFVYNEAIRFESTLRQNCEKFEDFVLKTVSAMILAFMNV